MQPLVARLLRYVQPAQTIAGAVFLWGVIIFLSILCDSFSKFMAVRFFLGAGEACVNPAFILISSSFYPRENQTFRVGIWFSANGLANIVGGIMTYGLGHIHAGGLAPWKWIYLMTGAISILWSIAVYIFLLASQGSAKFLSDDEKVAAVEMVRDNNTGIHNNTVKWSQVREALLDPKSYFFFWLAFGNLANSIATFGSQIISHFGFSPLQTTLLGMPSGGVEVLVMISFTWICIHYKNIRCLLIIAWNIIALVGSIVVFVLPLTNKAGLLIGYYMVFSIVGVRYAISLALAGSNTAGFTKKVVTNIFIMAGCCSSSIIGPQFFNKPPPCRLGVGSCIFTFAGMIVVAVLFQINVVWLNKKRAPTREAGKEVLNGRVETGFEDLTDKENPLFEYVY